MDVPGTVPASIRIPREHTSAPGPECRSLLRYQGMTMRTEYSLDDTRWITYLKTAAILAVILHHWLHMVPQQPSAFLLFLVKLVGPFVNLFFILSGCGLTLSSLRSGGKGPAAFFRGRFLKIVVPYWFVTVILFLVLKSLIHFSLARIPSDSELDWQVLLNYLIFTRNFFPEMNFFNPSHWFMPVIIGLYVLFPLLLALLKRTGAAWFLFISLLFSLFFLLAFDLAGYVIEHRSAIALFYIFEFSFGMALGDLIHRKHQAVRTLTEMYWIPIGLVLFTAAWYLTRIWPVEGTIYNGPFTTLGLFMILIGPTVRATAFISGRLAKTIESICDESFYMYILHAPFMLYVITPALRDMGFRYIGIAPSFPALVLFILLLFLASNGLRRLLEAMRSPLLDRADKA